MRGHQPIRDEHWRLISTNHSRSLTPLYQSCATVGSDPAITETLLHDHAVIGAQDLQGWQEVHQVSRALIAGNVLIMARHFKHPP